MRLLIVSALTLAAAVTAGAEEPAPAAPGFTGRTTGDGMFIYHKLSGDCETLTHAHGRNAAWGLWRLPLAEVTASGPETNDAGEAVARFVCRDDSACIAQGALTETPDRVKAHDIPFASADLARAYLADVAALASACKAG